MTTGRVSPEDRGLSSVRSYRTDEARDRERLAAPTQLAIVESAAQHRGWVKADDKIRCGLRLTLWLPLHKRT